MKRSDAVTKLLPFVIDKTEIIRQDFYGIYRQKAERLLTVLEKELGMLPPVTFYQGYEVPRWDDEDSDG